MTEQIELERMGTDACAVGHLANGKTVFVEHGAPHDVVIVDITEEKATFARGRIIKIVEPSPLRSTPACPFAGQCGGCTWQHLNYNAQLSAKRNAVIAALVHIGGFSEEAAREIVQPVAASKREWGYRNKLELSAKTNQNGRFELGFCKDGSHDITFIEHCPLVHKPLEHAPKSLRGALRYVQGNTNLGIFRIGLRGSVRTKSLEIALWTKPSSFPRAAAVKVLQDALPETTSIVRVLADPGKARAVKKVEVLSGKGMWEESLHQSMFLTSAPSFFQVNTAQAEKLIDHVIDGLGGVSNTPVADLYAGGGTFSIPLAKAGATVVAIEAAGSSVRDLQRNANANKVDINVIGGDAARQIKAIGSVDALVVDPPRAGLAPSVIQDIVKAHPKHLAYVSCNPATWARDIARFSAQGYFLKSVQPVDMFPQTYHVEVVSILAT